MIAVKDWLPQNLDESLPIYRALADAIELDVSSGRLKPGDRLPPQRKLAAALGVDFTTISRAYQEGKKRGVLAAQVGQGTYVSYDMAYKATQRKEIDMGMNMPPIPSDTKVMARLHREMGEAVHRLSATAMFGYQDFIGSVAEREIAAQWIKPMLPCVDVSQLMITPGTQSALIALLYHLIKPGQVVVSEHLTYPGFRILTRQIGVTHLGLECDEDGIIPSAFRKMCKEQNVGVLYCTTMQHNPTTITWSQSRRVAIAEIAREFDVKIIEDDAYGALLNGQELALSHFAPERSYYVAGLAKCLMSALRISFLHVPNRSEFQHLSMMVRSTATMASPITKAMALNLIASGCAGEVRDAIVVEARKRQKHVNEILPRGSYESDPSGFHLWLRMSPQWHTQDFIAEMRSHDIRLIGAGAFSVREDYPQAVRLCLGALENDDEVVRVLSLFRDTLRGDPYGGEVLV